MVAVYATGQSRGTLKTEMTDLRTPRPWERRLKDLSFVLANCARTYFDPELFRMHTNHFLQTARTVTFIIQKNKGGIPEFEAWYSSEVQDNWRMDEVMLWARDARNKIEKVGDLELYSSLQATLMFSYLEEEDLTLECGRHELLRVGVKRLVRFARRQLPTGVSDTAAVRIERRWVATSLPNWELLHALTYVYSRLYACCNKLAVQLGGKIASDIPSDTAALHLTGEARHVTYVKLRGMKGFQSRTDRVGFDSGYEPRRRFVRQLRSTLKSCRKESLSRCSGTTSTWRRLRSISTVITSRWFSCSEKKGTIWISFRMLPKIRWTSSSSGGHWQSELQ